MTLLRIRLLRQSGVESAEKTVFASRCGAALLAFPFEGKVSAQPTDEVKMNKKRVQIFDLRSFSHCPSMYMLSALFSAT